MVHGENRIPYRIDRRLTGLAGPDNDATISFGLPIEPEDSQYGESRLRRRRQPDPDNSYPLFAGNRHTDCSRGWQR